jgi:hypothetical protein
VGTALWINVAVFCPDRARRPVLASGARGRAFESCRAHTPAVAEHAIGTGNPHGKRGVTPDTALRLAQVLRMPADFWLGLQQDWDLWHAMHSPEGKSSIARRLARHLGPTLLS